MPLAAPLSTAPPARRSERLAWVVVLRGFATLWVYSYHLWNSLGGTAISFGFAGGFTFGLRSFFRAGYQGVDLFFVLSGFVIAWPYLSSATLRLDRARVADFYWRRYFRIAPLYYVTIVVAVLLIHAHWLNGNAKPGPVLAHFAFLQNYVRGWDVALRAVYWTLPPEMGFYLAFPWVLRFVDLDRPWRFAAFWIAVAIAWRGGIAWSTLHGGWPISWAANFLPGRMDQFACGMAAAALLARPGAARAPGLAATLVTGAIAAAGIMWVGRHVGGLDVWFWAGPSFVGVLIAAFIVVLGRHVHGARRDFDAPRSAVNRLAMRLGEASFGIYLWHTFFIDLADRWWRNLGLGYGARVAMLLATVPFSIAMARVTWRLVEKPCIEWSRRSLPGIARPRAAAPAAGIGRPGRP